MALQLFGVPKMYLLSDLDTENHILDDVNKCVHSLQEGYADTLDRTAGAIRGRAARVCNVVTAEMDNYEPGTYTDRVLEAIKVLRDQGTNIFSVRRCLEALDTKKGTSLMRIFASQ